METLGGLELAATIEAFPKWIREVCAKAAEELQASRAASGGVEQPTEQAAQRRAGEQAMNDTQRLAWLITEECVPEGFVHVRRDRYEYAMQAADEAGRDEPTDADCLEGLRRLIDCAAAGGDMPHVMPPNGPGNLETTA